MHNKWKWDGAKAGDRQATERAINYSRRHKNVLFNKKQTKWELSMATNGVNDYMNCS